MKTMNDEGDLVDFESESQIGHPRQSVFVFADPDLIEEHMWATEMRDIRKGSYERLKRIMGIISKTDFSNIEEDELTNVLVELSMVTHTLRNFPHSRVIDFFDKDKLYGVEMTRVIQDLLPYWRIIVELSKRMLLVADDVIQLENLYYKLEAYFNPQPELEMDPIVVETEM